MLATHEYHLWLDNEEWYDIADDGTVTLTDKAPAEARISYEKFQELCKKEKELGLCII